MLESLASPEVFRQRAWVFNAWKHLQNNYGHMTFSMSSILPMTVGIAAATYALLVALLHFTQDAKEPTSISDTIPFISPIVNMVSKGGDFHRLMR